MDKSSKLDTSEHPVHQHRDGSWGFDDECACDPTEEARRTMAAQINAEPGSRATLEAEHGQVWNTIELSRDFDVIGFAAPFVVVKRKSDGVRGSLLFQHHPRFYFCFQAG